MARVNVSVAVSSTDGTVMTSTAGDATNDMAVANSGKTLVLVVNTGAVTRTSEVEIQKLVDGQAVTKKSKSVTAGQFVIYGPFPRSVYGSTLWMNTDHAELVYRAIEPGA